MSYSNMNMVLDILSTTDARQQVASFGNWTGVGLVIADESDPQNVRFAVFPAYGPVPSLQLSP
jgi:hypothetical protein